MNKLNLIKIKKNKNKLNTKINNKKKIFSKWK